MALLRLIDQAALRVYVLSDILRSLRAYAGFACIAPLLFHRSFVMLDGLDSIQRAFAIAEARNLIRDAALTHPVTMQSLFPGRLVIAGGDQAFRK